jgi:penicillin-binding protein activator
MNAKQNTALILIVCASVLSACAAPKTRYGDAQAVETVKNTFGSTDLQMMAESMTRSMLASAVIQKADRPVITLSGVRNKTNEYIDTNAITNSIRAQMLKSGSVRFAVDRKDMDNQVAELEPCTTPSKSR